MFLFRLDIGKDSYRGYLSLGQGRLSRLTMLACLFIGRGSAGSWRHRRSSHHDTIGRAGIKGSLSEHVPQYFVRNLLDRVGFLIPLGSVEIGGI